LRKYPGSALIVSHDRDLLNASVHRIAHLAATHIRTYEGGYDDFQRLLAEKQRLDMAMNAKQEDQKRRMQTFVDRFRYSAAKAKQAQSRIKMMEKMQPVATLIQNPVAPIDLPNPKKEMAPPIIRIENGEVGYEPGKPILRNLNLNIETDDRIGLLGQNGEGKSTFAKLLSNKLTLMAGQKYQHKKLEIAYFAQHQLDVLDHNLTPYDHICNLMPEASEAQRRARLGRFGLGVHHVDTKTKDLSGGEKARLLLNLIAFNGPHLLILDEPTNHLDMDSRLALADALDEYSGAILLISHDRSLIERCIERLWLVKDGAVTNYDGDMNEYKKLILQKDRKRKTKPKPDTKIAQRQATADARADLAPTRRNIARLEQEIGRLQQGVASIDRALASPELYDRSPAQASEFNRKRSRALERILMLEEQCLHEMEKLESDT